MTQTIELTTNTLDQLVPGTQILINGTPKFTLEHLNGLNHSWVTSCGEQIKFLPESYSSICVVLCVLQQGYFEPVVKSNRYTAVIPEVKYNGYRFQDTFDEDDGYTQFRRTAYWFKDVVVYKDLSDPFTNPFGWCIKAQPTKPEGRNMVLCTIPESFMVSVDRYQQAVKFAKQARLALEDAGKTLDWSVTQVQELPTDPAGIAERLTDLYRREAAGENVKDDIAELLEYRDKIEKQRAQVVDTKPQTECKVQ